MPENAKKSETVPLAQLLDGALTALRAEARRRRDRSGLRSAEVDLSADALRALAARYRSALLPAAPRIAETLLEVLLASNVQEADERLWSTAADCAIRWPGSFREFCITLLADVARRGRLGWVGGPIDPSSSTLDLWTNVLLSCTGSIAGSTELREYTETAVINWQTDRDPGSVAAHVDVLVSVMRPSSPSLNAFALRVADRCVRHGDISVAVIGHRLRLSVSAVCHPRCAPLHVPLVAPERAVCVPERQRDAAAGPPLGNTPASTQGPATSRVLTEAPMPIGHRPSEKPFKTSRTETGPLTTAPGRQAAVNEGAGFEVPDIVDDDLA